MMKCFFVRVPTCVMIVAATGLSGCGGSGLSADIDRPKSASGTMSKELAAEFADNEMTGERFSKLARQFADYEVMAEALRFSMGATVDHPCSAPQVPSADSVEDKDNDDLPKSYAITFDCDQTD